MAEFFPSALITSDFIGSETVACLAGEPKILNKVEIKAGEEIAIGYGSQNSLNNAVGRLFAKIMDNQATPALARGLLRISLWSPKNRPLEIMYEGRTERLSQGETDYSQRVPMSEHELNAVEDQFIVFEFVADENVTISRANSECLLDTTVYVV